MMLPERLPLDRRRLAGAWPTMAGIHAAVATRLPLCTADGQMDTCDANTYMEGLSHKATVRQYRLKSLSIARSQSCDEHARLVQGGSVLYHHCSMHLNIRGLCKYTDGKNVTQHERDQRLLEDTMRKQHSGKVVAVRL